MKEASYVAGQIERALHGDPRAHELGIRVEVDGEDVVLRGQVASAGRRRRVAQIAAEQAPGLGIRNEVSVTEVLPPEGQEKLPLPGEATSSREVPPSHGTSR